MLIYKAPSLVRAQGAYKAIYIYDIRWLWRDNGQTNLEYALRTCARAHAHTDWYVRADKDMDLPTPYLSYTPSPHPNTCTLLSNARGDQRTI